MDDKELDTLGGGTIEKDGLKKNMEGKSIQFG